MFKIKKKNYNKHIILVRYHQHTDQTAGTKGQKFNDMAKKDFF